MMFDEVAAVEQGDIVVWPAAAYYTSFASVGIVIYVLRTKKGCRSLPEAINDRYGPLATLSFGEQCNMALQFEWKYMSGSQAPCLDMVFNCRFAIHLPLRSSD
jgi:hypothetical protein